MGQLEYRLRASADGVLDCVAVAACDGGQLSNGGKVANNASTNAS